MQSFSPALLHVLEPTHDVGGWHAQEKHEGARACWNGAGLFSRSGKRLNVPGLNLPSGIPLDGELHFGRGGFRRVLSALAGGDWQGVRFTAFDVPDEIAPIEMRLARLESLRGVVEIAETRTVSSYADAREFARQVFHAGGEGAVFKRPGSRYAFGRRSWDWLKFAPGR